MMMLQREEEDRQHHAETVTSHAKDDNAEDRAVSSRDESRGGKRGHQSPKSCNGKDQNCVDVATYSLDSYVSRFVPESAPISYLSVDAEGYDHEVLLGGGGAVLARVRYLQFEYNWVGPWSDRSLRRAVDRLDREFGFTCYWAGFNNTLWRITRCWLEHYDLHFWSNVTCVSREAREARQVADGMEMMFLDTLARGEENVRDFEHRSLRKDK